MLHATIHTIPSTNSNKFAARLHLWDQGHTCSGSQIPAPRAFDSFDSCPSGLTLLTTAGRSRAASLAALKVKLARLAEGEGGGKIIMGFMETNYLCMRCSILQVTGTTDIILVIRPFRASWQGRGGGSWHGVTAHVHVTC